MANCILQQYQWLLQMGNAIFQIRITSQTSVSFENEVTEKSGFLLAYERKKAAKVQFC